MKEKILFKVNSLGIGGVERLTVDILNNLSFDDKEFVLLLEKRDENDLLYQIKKEIEIIYLIPRWLEEKVKKIKEKKRKNIYYKIQYGILLEIERHFLKKTIRNYIKNNNVKLFVDYAGSSLKYVDKIGKNIKKVVWLHMANKKVSEAKKKRYVKKLRNYDRIITICNEMREELLKLDNSLKDKVEVIYNFVDEESIKLKMKDEIKIKKLLENRYCMMLGRIEKHKDYITAIKAFAKLRKDNIEEKLYIVGEGAFLKEIEKEIKINNLENDIYLIGKTQNPYPLLKNADIFIHTSRAEGFGLVLVEAANCGVPVISSDYKVGAKEILENGKNGMLFRVGNEEELYENIKLLLSNNELKKKYVSEFNSSLYRFSKKNILKKYKKLFLEMSINEKVL